MVRMRLTRVGSKKNPIYRVVVADSRSPRDGRFIEIVGRYNPQTDPSTIELDADKVKDWLAKGAQPSDPVARLIKVFFKGLLFLTSRGRKRSCSPGSRVGSSTSRTPSGWSESTRATQSSCGFTWPRGTSAR